MLKRPERDSRLKCWVCRRTDQELGNSLDLPTQRETELDRLATMVDRSKADFEKGANGWAHRSSEHLDDLVLGFVLKHPEQFESLGFVGEVVKAKKFLVDPLSVCIREVKAGRMAGLGAVEVSGRDEREAELINVAAREFEERNGCRIGDGKAFDGMSLRRGLSVLKEAGLLYFSIQKRVLETQKQDARRTRPKFEVSLVNLKDIPAPVPVCGVCLHVLRQSN